MTFRELELHRTPSAGSLSNVLSSPPHMLPPPPAATASEMTEDTTTAEPAGEGGIVELLEEPVEEMVSAVAGSKFVTGSGQTRPCFHT